MAFIKNGDQIPILDLFDNECNLKVCAKCKQRMLVLAIDDENQILCETCDLQDQIEHD